MSWTVEQAEAIHLREHNILVSASAGSGKTAVLVERILTLVTSEFVPLSDFLVVTFTNAAAQEMRERIAKRLVALKRERPEARAFINEQLQRVQQAHVSTLHSFCKDLIAQHFYALGIDPNFRIGSQQILELLQQEALDQLLAAYYEAPSEAFEGMMAVFSSHRGDEALRRLILNLYQFSRAHPYPEQWLNTCLESYRLKEGRFEETALAQGILQRVQMVLMALVDQLSEGLALCSGAGGPAAYGETLTQDLEQLETVLELVDSWRSGRVPLDWRLLEASVGGIAFERLKSIKKADKDSVDELVSEAVKALRDSVKKSLTQLKKQYFFEPLQDALAAMADMAPHLELLIDLVRGFAEGFWQLKVKEQLLDFNDLEQLTIRALNDPDIAEVYRRQFRYVFVDEYQDNNRVQEEIVGLMKRADNLFQVGDVKQSIYRFRMAEPELFLERFHRYPKEAGSRRIDLNRNFRTHPDILHGVNCVFDSLMTEAFGGLDYTRDGRLVAGRTDFMDRAQPRMNLVIGEEADQDPEGGDVSGDGDSDGDSEGDGDNAASAEGNEAERGDPEAEAIYERLMALMQEEFYDTSLQQRRRYRLSDIVVLMRSIKGRAQALRDFMAVRGIPVAIDEEDSYFDIVEVANVINCLKVLDNQQQDIPLLGVMRSPIGGFQDWELAAIRLWAKDSFHQALQAFIQAEAEAPSGSGAKAPTEAEEALRQKAQGFQALLESLRAQSHLPASDFLWYLLSHTGYWYYVIGLEDGHYRRQHLEVLMEKARQFELERQSGLHHFVDYLGQLQRARVAYGGKANAKTEVAALRVMSIHKSKGLEFPVVFLAGAARRFNLQDSKARLVLHQRYGLGVKWLCPETRQIKDTLPLAHLRTVSTEESVMEEARILYVALTRAIYRLEVFATIKDLEKAQSRWVRCDTPFKFSQQRSYADWIMGALQGSRVNSGQEAPWEVAASGTEAVAAATQAYEERLISLMSVLESAEATPWASHQPRVDAMPAKLSVTELKQQGKDLVYIPRITTLSQDFEPEQEGILRGNAYHAFAEHMPLDETPWDQVLSQLIQEGHLSEAQIALMTPEHLKTLRESAFYQRLLRAERIWREHPFVWRKTVAANESTLIQGVVDMLFLEADGFVLLDYKSDRLSRPQEFVERYQRQLALYKEAIEALTQKPVKEMAIYAFHIGAWITL